MRVLHVMSGFGGGISSFIYNKALCVDHTIIFDVVTFDSCSKAFQSAIESTGGTVYRICNPKKEGLKKFKQQINFILSQEKYDVVHCHVVGYRALPFYFLMHKQVKKFYIHAHDSRGLTPDDNHFSWKMKINQGLNRWMSDAILGCGELAIRANFGKINPSEMMMIPNSIEIDRFLMDNQQRKALSYQLKQKYGISQNTFVIGQIARLSPVKNPYKLIELANYLKEKQLDIKILLFGTGTLENELQQLIEEKQLSPFIQLMGRVERIESIAPICDSLVLTSFFEGLPTVAVESQALGIPMLLNKCITSEVDLSMNLIDWIEIDADSEQWINKCLDLSQRDIPSSQERLDILSHHYFTNSASAKLYVKFLQGKISVYRIQKEDV